MKPVSFFNATLLSLSLVLLSACGGGSDTPPLGTVTGVVTLDDKPLADAEVTFQPEKGRPSLGKTDSEGNYTLVYTASDNGALIGTHKVLITTAVEAFSDESGAGNDREARPEILPPKYNAQTTLTAQVKPGTNTIDFPLKSKE
ncbi:MAG: hypothetical protein KDA74_25305 [Planctomycetaceae bacterium]|nr:hypothetical protein [Planctomycetaceae bacterium]